MCSILAEMETGFDEKKKDLTEVTDRQKSKFVWMGDVPYKHVRAWSGSQTAEKSFIWQADVPQSTLGSRQACQTNFGLRASPRNHRFLSAVSRRHGKNCYIWIWKQTVSQKTESSKLVAEEES